MTLLWVLEYTDKDGDKSVNGVFGSEAVALAWARHDAENDVRSWYEGKAEVFAFDVTTYYAGKPNHGLGIRLLVSAEDAAEGIVGNSFQQWVAIPARQIDRAPEPAETVAAG